jgi:tRNA A-37 threonylcarbamoyl transferase component Bud32
VPDLPTPDATAPVRPHARAGHLIAGRYALIRLIASGGMAEVWEAKDQVLGREVAVKLLHRHLADNATFTQRFRAEAIAAARLHHPSIVSIYDTCTDDGQEAIVMELVRGRTLRQYLDERHQLDPDEVVQIGADVADALDAAHRARVIHRDIKPANILLCDDARVMVTDFGIAKVRDDTDLTNTGTMLGTVKYLAPEQVESGPVDARTDIYALGVVLYEALVGRPPFSGDTAAATALARLHQTPPSPRHYRTDVSPALDGVVMRALARDPANRFASASELRAEILAPQSGAAVPASSLLAGTDATTVADRPVTDSTTWGPPPPRPAPAHPPAASTTASTGRPRDWLLPTLLVLLIGGSIGLAVALVARTQTDAPSALGGNPGGVASISTITAFDPLGDGQEHDDEAHLAGDGNPDTAWHSETYATRDFGGGKAGVGLVVTLDRAARLDQLRVTSPTQGWAAEVYVAETGASSLDGWGSPVASASDLRGDATFDLRGSTGRAVLLWFTSLGDPPYRAQIDELSITT